MGKLGQRAKSYWTKPVLFSAVILVLIFLASVILKYFILRGTQEPTFLGDEMVYKVNAYLLFTGKGGLNMHYPPFYSLILAPSFLFQNFYTIMKLINVVVSSASIFPIYWLAHRWLPRKTSYLLCAVSLLLPAHWTYPQYISSENLLLPLVVLGLYFVTKPLSARRLPNVLSFIWFGLLAGIMFWTRYQAVAIVAVFGIYLIIKLFHYEKARAGQLFRVWQRLCLLILYGVVAIAVIVGFVALYPGVFDSFKGELTWFLSPSPSEHAPSTSFLQWVVWYVAYLLLAVAPFVLPLLLNLKEYWEDTVRGKYNGMLLLSFLICGSFGFIAARHSYSMDYNQSNPLYMLGRYLTYAVLLLVVNGFILLFRNLGQKRKSSTVYTVLVISVFLILLSYYLLYGVIGSAKFMPFIKDRIVTADIAHFTLLDTTMLFFTILLMVATAVVLVLGRKEAGRLLSTLLLVFGLVSIFPVFNQRLRPANETGFSQVFYRSIERGDEPIALYNATVYGNNRLQNLVDFWHTTDTYIKIVGAETEGESMAPTYVLSNIPLYEDEPGRQLYLYALPLSAEGLTDAGKTVLVQQAVPGYEELVDITFIEEVALA